MCVAYCCSLHCCGFLAALVAALIGAASYLSDPMVGPAGEAFVVKNENIRNYLERDTLKGEMVSHPRYQDFPVKGVYLFQYLGPCALIDFSHLSNWDQESNTFELDMTWPMLQSGLPWEQMGTGGPFLPGGLMGKGMMNLNYRNKWTCVASDMRDGQNCTITASFLGSSYESDVEGMIGITQWFIKRAGGRLWVRDTTWMKKFWLFHHYNLHRVVDENGQIDSDNFALLMEKLGGQDLYYFRPELAPH